MASLHHPYAQQRAAQARHRGEDKQPDPNADRADRTLSGSTTAKTTYATPASAAAKNTTNPTNPAAHSRPIA